MGLVILNKKQCKIIEQESIRKSTAEIAKYLQDKIGQKITAYACGLKEPKEVGKLIKGTEPNSEREQKIRMLYHATRIILEAYDDKTTVAWLFGSNSRLDNKAPAYILRHAKFIEALRSIVPAALEFVGPS